MTDTKPNARTVRLKAALRENLKRRKGQVRSREALAPSERSEADDERPGSSERTNE